VAIWAKINRAGPKMCIEISRQRTRKASYAISGPPSMRQGRPPSTSAVLKKRAQHPRFLFVVDATPAEHWVFAGESKEIAMRKLLIGSAAVVLAALAATPAAAQYYGYGYSPYSYSYSPYSYGYGYSPYSYGYSPYSYGYSYPSYGYSYPSYSYGYSYPSVSFGYSNYGYSYPSYRSRSYYGCRLRQHHRNGVVYYTRDC
jgi:hypothetical protein